MMVSESSAERNDSVKQTIYGVDKDYVNHREKYNKLLNMKMQLTWINNAET